jgi:hypothetical protein
VGSYRIVRARLRRLAQLRDRLLRWQETNNWLRRVRFHVEDDVIGLDDARRAAWRMLSDLIAAEEREGERLLSEWDAIDESVQRLVGANDENKQGAAYSLETA